MTTTYYSRARERALQQVDAPRAGSWVVVQAPDNAELDLLARNYGLDRDNLDDAVDIYEAPRVEVDDRIVYIYTRYCYPEGTQIATEPMLLVYTPDCLITVVRAKTPILDRLKDGLVDVVTTQKTKTLLQVLTEVNRSFEQQVVRVSRRILQFRAHLRQAQISTREFVSVIELEEDLNEFLSALQPQSLLFDSILSGKYLRLYEEDRDIFEDLERGASELIEQVRGQLRTLTNMRQAYDAIATNNLNNTFKRLTSIAIFLTIPTIIGGLWGMNVGVPMEQKAYGFWVVLAITGAVTAGVVWLFHRKHWL